MKIEIKEYDMEFPDVEWDKIDKDKLSSDIIVFNPFKGKKAFSITNTSDMYSGPLKNVLSDNNHKFEGIDLPALLKKDDKSKTIMIIGESPVRRATKKWKEGLYFGTPFAVACKEGTPPQSDIYKFIFCRLLDEGYSVYITDAVKIWHNGLKREDFIGIIDEEILRSEIENINPHFIVAWGETARTACYNIYKGDEKCYFHQTHPVNSNWDRWKVKMLVEAVLEGKGIGCEYAKDEELDKKKTPQYLAQFIAEEILNKAKGAGL